MEPREILAAYVEDYFDALSGLCYDDLAQYQSGGFANLAFGAAGIAYACWNVGRVLQDDELLAAAETWVRAAVARQRGDLAFSLEKQPSKGAILPGALVFGPAGLYLVRVLVADARADRAARRRAVARFIHLSRRTGSGPPELYQGTAGCLAGAAILWHQTGDPRLRALGDELADHLLRHAVRDDEDQKLLTWRGLHGLGLAHGTGGACHALLLWAAAAGFALPPWFSPCLEEIFAVVLREPRRLCADTYHHQLCGGFAGLTLLAVKAYQVLREPRFLEAARGGARLALARPPAQLKLCCGRAGVGFACLALSREDAAGPWRKHAQELALSALLHERRDWPYLGLFFGEAGMACLALNLAAGIDCGAPCLDLPQLAPRSGER